ncbi:LysR family transcriptional regulator [Erythrobacter sp. SG61-1L]|uniref:LysR family transcriptional regulator n=1 Tax=Erythrobacter sp. SG61-1L TaxID=1603897 RepID=UPI0006C92A39|nr:LysR family transcriptional regulator [Erythrobacter sp. SG61-1L]
MTGVDSDIALKLDWNLVRTFLVIVEEGSITGAAIRLDLKQPSVSNALRRLEETLGHRLIERGPRNFAVTPQGQVLYAEARDMFGAIERLPGLLADVSGEVSGTVALAMATHVVSPLVDGTLAEFQRSHPSASVSIHVRSSRQVVEDVRARRAPLGICLAGRHYADITYTHLYTEHFGFFCGPGHPLFGRKGLKLEDLAGERSVSFDTDQIDDVLSPVAVLRARASFSGPPVGVSNNLEEVRRMVIAGLGIGPLPIHVVARDCADGLLWRLPPYDDPPAVDVSVVRLKGNRLSRAEAAFCAILDRRIAETPLDSRTYGLDRHFSRSANPRTVPPRIVPL